jgi:type 1 glutamine amidotransferase
VRLFSYAAAVLLAAACSSPAPSPSAGGAQPNPTPPPPTVTPVRVLMLTATYGFRHDSIATARQVLSSLAARSGAFTVTATENVADVTADRLSTTDVLMFAMTTGELPFDAAQKSAILAFVNNGGGFIGTHSATDTLYDWGDYGRLVGAYFKEHPWIQEATVTVEDGAHPTTSGLGASFRLLDEYYTFRDNPRPSVHVLLSLNAASVGASGDYPLAWTQTIGRGRSYYNALGHFSETWNDTRFQNQIASAIRWTSGR